MSYSNSTCKIFEDLTSQFEDIKQNITLCINKEIDTQLLKGFEILSETSVDQMKQLRSKLRLNKKSIEITNSSVTINKELLEKPDIVKLQILSCNCINNATDMLRLKEAMESNPSDEDDTINLKLFAGDGLGSPSKFSFIFNGLDMIMAIKLCKFDVYGLGNHEFNERNKVLKTMVTLIDNKFLCSNIPQEDAQKLGLDQTQMLLTGDIRIGAIAYTTQDTPLIATNAADLKFNDFNTMLSEHSEFIKSCDSVLLIWHAASFNIDSFNLKPENYELLCNKIHVVFGGHKQTRTVTKIPISSIDNRSILYVDGGLTNAVTLGVTNLSFNLKTRRFESAEAKFVDTPTTTPATPIRTAITSLVSNIAAPAFKEAITTIQSTDLDGLSVNIKKAPTTLTTLIANAYLYNGRKMIPSVKPENMCAVFNVGSIKNNSVIKIGTILNTGLLYTILPYNNSLVAIKVQGYQKLLTLLEYLGTTSSTKIGGNGFLGKSSNLSFDSANKFIIQGSSELDSEDYCVIMPDYIQSGGDGYIGLLNYLDIIKLDLPIQNALKIFILSNINSV